MTRSGMLLAALAIIEGATSLILIAVPSAVVRLILAADLDASGAIMARFAGIVLLALSLACWLSRNARDLRAALVGMLAYNALVAAYFGVLGVSGEFVGLLLWPLVAAHVVFTALLVFAWVYDHRASTVALPAKGRNR